MTVDACFFDRRRLLFRPTALNCFRLLSLSTFLRPSILAISSPLLTFFVTLLPLVTNRPTLSTPLYLPTRSAFPTIFPSFSFLFPACFLSCVAMLLFHTPKILDLSGFHLSNRDLAASVSSYVTPYLTRLSLKSRHTLIQRDTTTIAIATAVTTFHCRYSREMVVGSGC